MVIRNKKNTMIMTGLFGLLPLLFMHRSKFTSVRQHRGYILSVIGIGISILASVFVLRIGGLMQGDFRGGSAVSGIGQLRFMMANPWRFVHVLVRFLSEYLSLSNMGTTLTFMAYLGTTSVTWYAPCFLIILAITDRSEEVRDDCPWRVRILTWGGAIAAAAVIASYFYVSFTPVGYNTINGCQPRYLLPLIFPAFYVIGSVHIQNKASRRLYYYLGYSMSALMPLIAIWQSLVAKYV